MVEKRGRSLRWPVIVFVLVPSLVVVVIVALLAESFIRYNRLGMSKMNAWRTDVACRKGFHTEATDCNGFDPTRLEMPLDAYEQAFICEVREHGPTIVSYGRDGKPGGTGVRGDIACWRVESEEPTCKCALPQGF